MQAYVINENFYIICLSDTFLNFSIHYIICLSDTFLNFSIQNNDEKLKSHGYNLIRSDHPSDSKKVESVCVINKHISFIRRDSLCTLDKCLVTETQSPSGKYF